MITEKIIEEIYKAVLQEAKPLYDPDSDSRDITIFKEAVYRRIEGILNTGQEIFTDKKEYVEVFSNGIKLIPTADIILAREGDEEAQIRIDKILRGNEDITNKTHMTPTATQWRAILTEARRLQKQEEKIDKALNNYLTAINKSTMPAFHDEGMVHGFICAIKASWGDLVADDVSYYLYEVPNVAKNSGKCEVKDKDGNIYDANNLGSYIKFLVANYKDTPAED